MKKFTSLLLLIILVTTLIIITENIQAQDQETKAEMSPKIIYMSSEYWEYNPLHMRIACLYLTGSYIKTRSIREWFGEVEPNLEDFIILKVMCEFYRGNIGLIYIYIHR